MNRYCRGMATVDPSPDHDGAVDATTDDDVDEQEDESFPAFGPPF